MAKPLSALNARKRRIFFVAMLGIPVLLWVLLYTGYVVSRGAYSYWSFSLKEHSWVGNPWFADPLLGYANTPGFRGRQSLTSEYFQAVRIDERGFRIPEGGRPPGRAGPKVLSLGCSYTFGVGVKAEGTYTDLVAQGLGGTSYNGGVSGYGLAQMVMQSREMMKRIEPDIVLVAYSYWLPTRAQRRYSTARFAAIPTPYAVGTGERRVELAPPAFAPLVFDLNVGELLGRPHSISNVFSYFTQVVFPLFVHDDLRRQLVWWQEKLGRIPSELSGQDDRVARAGYQEIADNARAVGARVYVMEMIEPNHPTPASQLEIMESLEGVTFVHTADALWSQVEGSGPDDFLKVHGHWAGNPPVLIDAHPNNEAHQIMADQILEAIRGSVGG